MFHYLEYEYYDFCPEAIVGENEDIKGTPFDPYYLVDKAVTNNVDLPELLIMCGTEDALYQDNLDFIRYLNEKGVNYHFEKVQVIMIMPIGIRQLNKSSRPLHVDSTFSVKS